MKKSPNLCCCIPITSRMFVCDCRACKRHSQVLCCWCLFILCFLDQFPLGSPAVGWWVGGCLFWLGCPWWPLSPLLLRWCPFFSVCNCWRGTYWKFIFSISSNLSRNEWTSIPDVDAILPVNFFFCTQSLVMYGGGGRGKPMVKKKWWGIWGSLGRVVQKVMPVFCFAGPKLIAGVSSLPPHNCFHSWRPTTQPFLITPFRFGWKYPQKSLIEFSNRHWWPMCWHELSLMVPLFSLPCICTCLGGFFLAESPREVFATSNKQKLCSLKCCSVSRGIWFFESFAYFPPSRGFRHFFQIVAHRSQFLWFNCDFIFLSNESKAHFFVFFFFFWDWISFSDSMIFSCFPESMHALCTLAGCTTMFKTVSNGKGTHWQIMYRSRHQPSKPT